MCVDLAEKPRGLDTGGSDFAAHTGKAWNKKKNLKERKELLRKTETGPRNEERILQKGCVTK